MATANPAFSSSKLTIETIDTLITETLETETLEQGVKYGVILVSLLNIAINFEHILYLVLVFLLLTLNMYLSAGWKVIFKNLVLNK